jgi:hypothetical protein
MASSDKTPDVWVGYSVTSHTAIDFMTYTLRNIPWEYKNGNRTKGENIWVRIRLWYMFIKKHSYLFCNEFLFYEPTGSRI